MENLYERTIELIGATPRHGVVRKFIQEIGEKPEIDKAGSASYYNFPNHGISFWYNRIIGNICSIDYYLGDKRGLGDLYHGWKTYQGNLPANIKAGDSRTAIMHKLGGKPTASNLEQLPVRVPPNLYDDRLEKWAQEQNKKPKLLRDDTYEYPPYSLLCRFRKSDKKLLLVVIYDFSRRK